MLIFLLVEKNQQPNSSAYFFIPISYNLYQLHALKFITQVWVEKQTGLQLASSQKAAITQALQSKVMIISGGPGVGKTTVVNSLIKIFSTRQLTIELCAPTGRAAKRLSIGQYKALAIAVHQQPSQQRLTQLVQRMNEIF